MSTTYSKHPLFNSKLNQSINSTTNVEIDNAFKLLPENWIVLDENMITYLFQAYDYDPDIRALSTIKLDAILASDILIDGIGVSKNLNKYQIMAQSNMWKQWCASVYRSILSVGFAGVSFKENLDTNELIPIVLDLTQLNIYYYLDVYNMPHMRYFLASTYEPVELENILSLWCDLPTKDGQFTSKLSILLSDAIFESNLMNFALQAYKKRANPPLITERLTPFYNLQPYETSEQAATLFNNNSGNNNNFYNGDAIPGQQNDITSTNLFNKISNDPNHQMSEATKSIMMEHQYNLIKTLNSGYSNALYQAQSYLNRISGKFENDLRFNQIYLEPGRKLTRPNEPNAPETLMPFRLARLERVGAILGVPVSLLTTDTSTSHAKLNAGNNPNSLLLFENSVRTMKYLLCGYIETLYKFMFARDIAINTILNTEPNKHINFNNLNKEKNIHVFMSPLPQDAILNYLFENHILKYDSYCNYISKLYGFELSDFNSENEKNNIENKQIENELKLKQKHSNQQHYQQQQNRSKSNLNQK